MRKSDTPRTDKLLTSLGAVGNTSRIAEHARQLEIELADAKESADVYLSLLSQVPEMPAMRAALESIAANSCCDKCQEAAKVARAALGEIV